MLNIIYITLTKHYQHENKKVLKMVQKNNTSGKKICIDMYLEGWKVEVIARTIQRSKSTVYRYIQEEYDEVRFPILKDLIKHNLICGDFKRFIESLEYKDISLLRRKYHLYGYDKKSKIKAILDYFKHYSILGIYPDEATRETIKKAFFRRAKQTHPDLNKNLDKSGKEFQEIYNSYTVLTSIY